MENENLDLFTQQLLERTKARSEDLDHKMSETGLYTSMRKRPSPLREENTRSSPYGEDNDGKRPCRTSSQKSDKPRKSVSFSKSTKKQDTEECKENQGQALRGRLKKLAALHSSSDESMDSPPPKPARLYPDLSDLMDENTNLSPPSRPGRRNRLAALADTYKQLEDEPAPKPPPYRTNSGATRTPSKSPSGKQTSSKPTTLSNTTSGKQVSKTITNSPSSASGSTFAQVLEKFQKPQPSPGSRSPSLSKVGTPPSSIHPTTSNHGSSSPHKSPARTACTNVISKHSPVKVLPSPVKGSQAGKSSVWDQAVIATLEAQGFVHSESRSKLQYDFNKQQGSRMVQQKKEELYKKNSSPQKKKSLSTDEGLKKVSSRSKSNEFKMPLPPPPPMPGQTVKPPLPKETQKVTSKPSAGRANVQAKPIAATLNKFNPSDVVLKSTALRHDSTKPVVSRCHPTITGKRDPAELPLSARVAIFEQANQAEAEAAAASRFTTGVGPKKSPAGSPIKQSRDTPSKPSGTNLTRSPSKVGKATEVIHSKLFNRQEEWKQNEIASQIKSDREKEMKALLKRWEKNSSSDDVTARNDDASNGHTAAAATFRRPSRESITSSQSSELEQMGNLESSYSDESQDVEDEVYDEATVDEVDEVDYGRRESYASSVSSDAREPQHEESGEVEEASEESDVTTDSIDGGPNVASSLTSETSFVRQTVSVVSSIRSQFNYDPKPPIRPDRAVPKYIEPPPKPPHYYYPESTCESEDGSLMHSVSFYRRQQETKTNTPVRTVIHKTEEPRSPSPQKIDVQIPLKDKIKGLQEEVSAQQTIISQTSRALNLCRSTAEFFGSAEQVEGERLLLIATHKRMACMNEIQRLKTGSVMQTENHTGRYPATSGSLSVKEIRLPLKRDFLTQFNNGRTGDFVHFFLCLIKHGPQVVATQMLSTMDNVAGGALNFPNLINMRDLDCCFNIAFEVYGLQTRRDQVIPTERAKSLGKKEKSRLNLTPKKLLHKQDSKMTSIPVQSPGGPSAVRTSSFQLIGYTHINIQTLSRKTWVLEKVPFISPLEGSLQMQIHCLNDYHTEERGFLTMFEDVSGFGAWHRRWCVLSGTYLSFWKYPDDEKRKEPMGEIDLRKCVTSNVGLVARDICARPNTFLLLTVRPPEEYDTDTLVSQTYGTYTSIKHLLSADTREERILWCNVLNAVLSNIRMWDPHALRPRDFNTTSDSE